MSNKQPEVYSGNVAKYVEDSLVKDPEVLQKIVADMHPAAKKATETAECQSNLSAWKSCVQKNGENREACKLDAAKWLDSALQTFQTTYSIPAARIYYHCFDSLDKYNKCNSETPGQCKDLEKALRECAASSKSKHVPGL